MVRIDLARRAQIGRDRRARTRAELIRAARTLYAARPFDAVTVDDLVNAAGVAKGTFYVHFESLDDLQSVLADDLAREFDDLWQPHRASLDDPIELLPDAALLSNRRCTTPHGVRSSCAAPFLCRTSRGSQTSARRPRSDASTTLSRP